MKLTSICTLTTAALVVSGAFWFIVREPFVLGQAGDPMQLMLSMGAFVVGAYALAWASVRTVARTAT